MRLRHELGGLKNASEIQQLKHDLNTYVTSIQTQLAHSQNRDQVILDDNHRLHEQTVKIIQEAVAACCSFSASLVLCSLCSMV